MTRHLFGGDIAAYVVVAGSSETVGSITGSHTLLVPSVTVTFWTASSGGTQITDLLDMTNAAITSVITDSNGAISQLQGPDGTWSMWADANGGAGPRRLMAATDLTKLAGADLAAVTTAAGVSYAWDYGYRPGGAAATNTAAIQNALNALGANGGTVFIPPGYGQVNATIVIPARCGLRGAGHFASVLQLADASNCHMITNHVSTNGTTDPNGMFVTVQDLGLDCRGAHQTGSGPYYGILLDTNPGGSMGGADISYDATNRIINVYVRNAHDDGIVAQGRSDTVIAHCKVSVAGGNAFKARFDTHLIGCVAEKPSQAGFYSWGSNTMMVNCKAYACGQDGSSVNGNTAVPSAGHGFVLTGTTLGEMQAVGCDAQDVSGHGFHLSGVYGAVVSGCTVAAASFGNGTSFVAYNLDGATSSIVQGASLASTSCSTLRLVNSADGNTVTVNHTSLSGGTAGPAISTDTVRASNGITLNGIVQQIATVPDWAATTNYATGQLIKRLGFLYQVATPFTSGASFTGSNLTMLSAPMTGTVIPPGTYAFAGGGQAPSTVNTLGVGSLRVFPVYIPHAVTLIGIGAEVTTIGDVGSKYRVGIYADTGGLLPGALLLDAGQIAGDSATLQTLTVSQVLSPGLYWFGGVVQSVTTTQPTIRVFSPGPVSPVFSSVPSAGAAATGWFHASTVSGALPSTFTVSATAGSVPRIHLRA